jgi:hypothetical protein
MDGLLKEFQSFWQTNPEPWKEMVNYTEAFPHLLLMAFLQRITNEHGRIEWEYAAGWGRMDLAVEYNGAWNIIEIKLLRRGHSFEAVMTEGLRQTLHYRDTFSSALRSESGTLIECYLIIFDRCPDKPAWPERLQWLENGAVTMIGC